MKKLNIFVFFSAVLFLALPGSTFSQKMTEYTWDTYFVKFQVPVTFNVNKNNADAFSAGDDDVYIDIYPYKGEKMSFGKMKQAVEDWAVKVNVYGYVKVNELENLNGYWGVYIDGKKESNELPITLLLLIHPDYPTTKLYVAINYISSAFDTALKILNSFTPTY